MSNQISPTRHLPGRILAWLPAVLWAGLIFWLSDQPDSTLKDLGLSGDLLAIFGHLALYSLFFLLLVLALQKGGQIPSPRSRWVAIILISFFALSDEFHQSFVPGRTATLFDWVVDMIGALLAWAALKRRSSRQQ